MTDSELKKLSSLRSTIEGFGAHHAALHALENPAAIDPMRHTLKNLNQAARHRDYAAFRRADSAFHESIMEVSHVPFLREVWQTVWNALGEFHQRGFVEGLPDTRILMGEHEYLMETISRGDPVAAEDAARCHTEANWARIGTTTMTMTKSPLTPMHLATAYVSSHLHCSLRLNDVASRIAFTSPGNLSRLFRQNHGLSFQNYLQGLRMDKAEELLTSTYLPVATISRRVGYRDVSRFGQHFSRRFNTTPSEWRKRQLMAKATHPSPSPALIRHTP